MNAASSAPAAYAAGSRPAAIPAASAASTAISASQAGAASRPGIPYPEMATTDPLRSAALSAAAVSSSAATTSHTIMKRANIARDPEEVRQLRRAGQVARGAPAS